LKRLKILIIIIQILGLILYNFHCFFATNHTGLNIKFWAAMSFIFGTGILSVSLIIPTLIGKTDKLIIIIFGISVLTSLNILVFDYLNIFVEYETWLKRGMPDKPF